MSSKVLLAIGVVLVLVAIVFFVNQTGKKTGKGNMNNSNQETIVASQVAGEKAAEKIGEENPMAEIQVKGFGKIKAELYTQDAPKTVANFVGLAEKKYYDGVTFHRVAKSFVIQGGDPTGTGSGGESIYGGDFADELNPEAQSYKDGYKKGVLAMANRGPNTNTSQFFIMLEDNLTLPKNYTIFGKVVEGMGVVEKIGQVEIIPGVFGSTDGKPKQAVVMESIKILK